MPTSLTGNKISQTYPQIIHVDGGVTGTAKALYDGDGTATVLKVSTSEVEISGNLTIAGTLTNVNTTNLQVDDSLIQLGRDNNSSDVVDIGFVGLYDAGGTDKYAGLFRDANDSGKFKLFIDSQEDLSTTNTINTSATGYTVATLVANLEAATVNIDGGNIDGTTIATSDITVGTGKTLNVSGGTLTLANDQISGDAINGGTIGSVTISQLAGALDANNQAITNVNIDSGTIDGITTLTVDNITVNGSDINNSTGNFTFSHSGTEKLRITSDKVMFSADAKVDAGNTRDLGTSGTRWKDLYLQGNADVAGNGLFGGTITIGSVSDNGDALITNGASSGRYDVLTVQEDGNKRWDLSFEGESSTNSLMFASNVSGHEVSDGGILNLLPAGNVGINSSSPDEELEVFSKSGGNDVGIKLRALGTSSTAESHVPAISFQSHQGDGITARASISADRDGGATKGALIFKTRISDNITEAMRIDSSGQVTMQSRLTLANDGSDNGLFLGGGWQIFDNASEAFGTTGDLVFYHGATRVVMTDTGEMGIGTTSPASKLHINDGSLRVVGSNERILVIEDGGQNSVELGHSTSSTHDGFLALTDDSGTTQVLLTSGTTDNYIKNGKLGIGTSSPNHVLHINHATPVIQFTDTAQGILGYFGDATDFLPTGAGNDSFGLRSEGDLRFGAGGNNTRMMIDSSGNVSMGGSHTASSDFGFTPLLHLKKDGDIAFIIDNATEKFEFTMNDNSDYLRLASGSLNSILSIENTGEIYCGVRQLTLQKNTSHRFNVQAPVGTGNFISAFANNAAPAINLYRTNSTTIGSFTSGNTADNDVIGAINFYGSSNSAHRLGAAIDVRQDGTDDCEPNTPTRMDFYVSGGANISFPLMSLDGPANFVGIGNKTPAVKLDIDAHGSSDIMRLSNDSNSNGFIFGYTTNLGSIDLQASQAMRIRQGASVPLLINTNGVIDGNFNHTSDKALKKNIKDLGKTLENVNKIKPSTFKWKEETKSNDKQIGFIAQDIEKYFPELVHGEEGTKSINTLGVVSALMKAVHELSAKVTELEERCNCE